MKSKKHILPIIILAQFACTSVWFAGNSVVNELAARTGFGSELIGYILSAVQFGFITGTLTFALLMIADRFSPSRVFFVCAILAALCNLILLSENISKTLLLSARFGTGFFLAGIYPIGMKIAADYYEKGLGKALGFLVGALVFGKAFPYVVKSMGTGNSFESVILATSVFAALGGLLLWMLVPNGPFRRPSKKLDLRIGPKLFKFPAYRSASFGYFGHMWELYAFWAFVPFAMLTFNTIGGGAVSVPLWSAIVIALGGVSCILGGMFSLRYGSRKVAVISLAVSGFFCLVSPVLFQFSEAAFLLAFCIWGMAVTADSPQFSSLAASAIPAELKGTGLTLMNCIGFAISIASIELVSSLTTRIDPTYVFLILGIGPLLGLWKLRYKSH